MALYFYMACPSSSPRPAFSFGPVPSAAAAPVFIQARAFLLQLSKSALLGNSLITIRPLAVASKGSIVPSNSIRLRQRNKKGGNKRATLQR